MRYFYVLDYSEDPEGVPKDDILLWTFQLHFDMFHLAEKYLLKGLKFVAADKFIALVHEHFGDGKAESDLLFLALIKVLELIKDIDASKDHGIQGVCLQQWWTIRRF